MALELPPRGKGILVFESSVLALIDVVAIGGNFFICLVILRKRSLQTSANLWVAALAASDLVRSCITAPLTVGTLIQGRWNYGFVGCIIQGFCTYFLTLVSLLTMAFMAVNRFFRVVKPQMYKKIFTKRNSVCIITSFWLFLGLSVSFPVLVNWAEFAFYPGYAACVLKFYDVKFTRIFLTLDAVLILLPCMFTISGCYFKVSQAVRHHNLTVVSSLQRRNGPQNNLNVNVEEIRITRTLFLLVGTFGVCWIPAYIIGFLSRGELVFIPPQGTLAVTYLVGFNSAINPFIYGAMNQSFRQEFRLLIPHCCKSSGNRGVSPVKVSLSGSQHLALREQVQGQNKLQCQSEVEAWSVSEINRIEQWQIFHVTRLLTGYLLCSITRI